MIKDFDKLLSENSVVPEWVLIHPSIWNGYWSIIKRPNCFRIFRKAGRLFRSRRLYWLGLSIYWTDGLKNFFPEDFVPTEVFYDS